MRTCCISRHDSLMLLRDMLDHAAEAAELVGGRTREVLSANRLLGLSLTRLLEIVGEAQPAVSHGSRQNAILGFRGEISWAFAIGSSMVMPRLTWMSCGRLQLLTCPNWLMP